MSTLELIKQLREITQAGMKDCKDALVETNNDLEKAIDLIKVKGKNIVSGRAGRVAAEGLVVVSKLPYTNAMAMLEINCQTDFVARSEQFKATAAIAMQGLLTATTTNVPFDVNDPLVSAAVESIVSTTKENVVIRRWWVEEVIDPTAQVFSYVHTGDQLGVLLTLKAPSVEAASDPRFIALGNDLAMQAAAMSPIAISSEYIPADVKERQQAIFETQLTEAGKPQAAWAKILTGKFNKWYSESCLLEQESVLVPKTSVKDVVAQVGKQLGGDIIVATMIRCQVGEGLVKEKTDLADEVAKLM
jgi:elongation factor Ts